MFKRLLDWLPETPAPTDPILERLAQWITPPSLPITGADRNPALGSHRRMAGRHQDQRPARLLAVHPCDRPPSHRHARGAGRGPPADDPPPSGKPGPLSWPTAPCFETARWALEDGAPETRLRHPRNPPGNRHIPGNLQGEAAFLQAKIALRKRRQGTGGPAVRRSLQVASRRRGQNRPAERRRSHRPHRDTGNRPPDSNGPARRAGASPPISNSNAPSPRQTPERRRAAIEDFLTNHPDHPRAPKPASPPRKPHSPVPQPDLSFATRPVGNPRRGSAKNPPIPAIPRIA